MIPKVIHYCWFGGKELPKDVCKCIESWKKYCPDYKIIRWDESNFDVHSHPFMEAAYNEKCWAFVSDYARLKVVYDNGGIYLDTDVELVKSLDEVINNQCYFAVQQLDTQVASGLGFGSVAGHNGLRKMIEIYDSITFSKDKVVEIACPILNTKVIEGLGYVYSNSVTTVCDVTIYPPEYFDPYGAGKAKDLFSEKTISIHHYSATWTPRSQRIKRRLVRLIGQENTRKIKRLIGKL